VPIDDTTVEHDESVTISLTPDPSYTITTPGDTSGSATAMIVNNDFPTVTVTAADATTAADPATFTFTRTGELIGDDLTVYFDASGTAVNGQNYTLDVTGVTIPAGQLSTTLSVPPIAGTAVAGGKTVVLSVAAADGDGYTAGSPASATATMDNSTPTPTPTPNPPPAVTNVFVSGSAWSTSFKNYLAAKGLGDATFGLAVPASDPLNELPWTNIDQVSIRFSEAVDVQSGDLVVRGIRVPSYAIKTFAVDNATHTATWTLASPIANDKLSLDLDGSSPNAVRDLAGAYLDGEWANAADVFPSGDGTAGGDFRFQLDVLPGDVNRSGKVDPTDSNSLKKLVNIATTSSKYVVWDDVNGSGVIDATDLTLVKNRNNTILPSGTPA
jgi:hypothetical protein